MHLLGHCKWWVMGVRAIISNISEYPFSWNNQCDYWLIVAPFGPVWLNIQMARWQKDCKRKFTKLEEYQVRVTGREKLQGGISFIWLTLPLFFFFFSSLSLILAYLDFQRSVLTGILIAGMLVWEGEGFNNCLNFIVKVSSPANSQGQMAESRAVGRKVAFFRKTVQIIP